MSERDDGGPAFPWGEHGTHLGGMTLRDWFAGQALAGMCGCAEMLQAQKELSEHRPEQVAALIAYRYADFMLEARKK